MNHAGEVIPDGFPVDTLTGMETAWEVSPPRRSLAIVGSHPATRELAPYDNQNFDIWLFNEAPQKPEIYKRWDASFQMHLREVYSSTENWVNKDHWAWLQLDHGSDKVIWMQEVDERVPNSRRYPIEDVLALTPYHYLRSTPAMALALGILLGYREIWLYGSELTSNTEYTYQAVNYAFWIGFAHGYGVDLHLECWHNEFYEQPLYGYEGEMQLSPDYFKERYEFNRQEHGVFERKHNKMLDQMIDAMIETNFEKVAQLSLNLEESAMVFGASDGAMNEAARYMERTNPISRQEFERVAAQAQIDGEKVKADMHHEAGKCEYVWNVWKMTGRLEALNQFRTFMKQRTQYAFDAGKKMGVFHENMLYRMEYDKLITAAGGSRAVQQYEAMTPYGAQQ